MLITDESLDQFLIEGNFYFLLLTVPLTKGLRTPLLRISTITAPSKDSDELKLMPLMLFQIETIQTQDRVLLCYALKTLVGTVPSLQDSSAETSLGLLDE